MGKDIAAKDVLPTAIKLVRRGGLRAMVFDDIAAELEVDTATLQKLYPEDNKLWLAVLTALREEQETFLAQLGLGLNPRQRLSLFLDSFLDEEESLVARGSFFGGLLQDVGTVEGPLRDAACKLLQAELDWVVAQFNMMGLVDERYHLAHRLVGAVHGVTLLAHALDDPIVLRRQILQLKAWIRSM